MSNGRHRVVVVGGGFGGLNAARYLKDAPVDVTIVDRTNHHLFQPLLYQVAAGLISPGLIAPAIRATIKKQRNARALLGEVKDLDLDNKVVRALGPDGRNLDLEYDSLVVAAGASHSYFGKDEFAEYAPGMKTIEDARYLRDGILSKFEMAEMATDPVERAEWLTFVVIGAGPTGVELAGQLAELAHLVLPQEYRTVDTTEARIILLEGAPSVLPPFDEKLQHYTKEHLQQMGVEIRVGTLATDIVVQCGAEPVEQINEPQIAVVVDDDLDRLRAPAGQHGGGLTRSVAQLADRSQHRFAPRRAHSLRPAQHQGHQRFGDPGPGRHVVDRRTGTKLRGRLVHGAVPNCMVPLDGACWALTRTVPSAYSAGALHCSAPRAKIRVYRSAARRAVERRGTCTIVAGRVKDTRYIQQRSKTERISKPVREDASSWTRFGSAWSATEPEDGRSTFRSSKLPGDASWPE